MGEVVKTLWESTRTLFIHSSIYLFIYLFIICPFTELFIIIHLPNNLFTYIFFPLTELSFSVMSCINNIIQQAMRTENYVKFTFGM